MSMCEGRVVKGVDLPHLTNHSDTLVGVQIDNWRGETRASMLRHMCTGEK